MKITWITGAVAALALIAGPREAWAVGILVVGISQQTATVGGLTAGTNFSGQNGSDGSNPILGFSLGGSSTVTASSAGTIQYYIEANSPSNANAYGFLLDQPTSVTLALSNLSFTSTDSSSSVQLDVYGFWASAVQPTPPSPDQTHFTFSLLSFSDGPVNLTPLPFSQTVTAAASTYLDLLFVVTWSGVSIGDQLTLDPPNPIVIQAQPQILDTPEPSTLAMALTAFAGVGYAGWRTRRRGRAA